jgi:hypothetical protein
MTGAGDDVADPDDPFDRLVLDESFVRSASRSEASAEERSAAAQRSRWAHLDLQARRDHEIAAAEAAERNARRGRRRRGIVILTVLAVLVVAGAAVLKAYPDLLETPTDHAGGGVLGDVMTPLAKPDNRPTPQHLSSEVPLGTPAPATGDGPYTFIAEGTDGQPAAYDPCRPIPFVVNPRTAPPDADLLLDRALAEVTLRTGLQFVREGTTDEAPMVGREPFQPDRYGDRWAPVLIAWSDRTESPTLGEEAVGTGGSSHIEIDDHEVFVTGQVTLDGPTLAEDGQQGGGAEIQAVLMHELAHLVGLDHVSDPTQLMHDDNLGQRAFGDGDKAGLARLGVGRCMPRL